MKKQEKWKHRRTYMLCVFFPFKNTVLTSKFLRFFVFFFYLKIACRSNAHLTSYLKQVRPARVGLPVLILIFNLMLAMFYFDNFILLKSMIPTLWPLITLHDAQGKVSSWFRRIEAQQKRWGKRGWLVRFNE